VKHSLLIVDDDELVLEGLSLIFNDDYDVVPASCGDDAVKMVEQNPAFVAVILDIRMAKMNGFQVAAKLKALHPSLPVIFHSAYAGEYSDEEVDAKYQPFDYIGKGEDIARLRRSVRNAVELFLLKTNKKDLFKLAREQHGLIGRSRAMRELYEKIEQVAPTESKVMIIGETGTGKELVARAIHRNSKRAIRRMGILNCNHKSSDLVESELFGHLKGSFTGAFADRTGLFEYADGGTVFLDEIGDLDITTQAKLLRVLETGEIQKIGSSDVSRVDVRLICATHRDLKSMVEKGTFRNDLYYRLKGVMIFTPTLRERKEDIAELLDYFSEEYCRKRQTGLKVFDPKARELLIEHDWPGNVRELMDSIHSLIDITNSFYISENDVCEYLLAAKPSTNGQGSLASRLQVFKRQEIIKALDAAGGNISAAAEILQLDRSNLHRMMKSLDILTS